MRFLLKLQQFIPLGDWLGLSLTVKASSVISLFGNLHALTVVLIDFLFCFARDFRFNLTVLN